MLSVTSSSKLHFSVASIIHNSDADLVFHTIMAYQKFCYMNTQDANRANQTFTNTVTAKFTKEAFHTLRRYMSTLPDAKEVLNLQLRAQKFTDAGVTMARRALDKRKDTRERLSILAVSECRFRCVFNDQDTQLTSWMATFRRVLVSLEWARKLPSTRHVLMTISNC